MSLLGKETRSEEFKLLKDEGERRIRSGVGAECAAKKGLQQSVRGRSALD